jgi:hypothetical protein
MDLRLFHPKDMPNHSLKTMDRFNSWTQFESCRFLERIGWYYTSLPLLLLGHYRLFHLHQKYHSGRPNDTSLVNGYILACQATFKIKYSLNTFIILLYKIWRYPIPSTAIYIINRRLLHEQAPILHEFLTNADTAFEEVLDRTIQQIDAPTFLSVSSTANIKPSNVLVQVKHDHNTDVLRGKQKDVFSKKQVLILFDLLSQSTKIEPFDLTKPNKFDGFAQLLHALTGKSNETWLEELKSYRNKDLYAFHDSGELDHLLNTLTNLSNTLRKAGLRTLSNQADKKIRELDGER